MATKKTSTSKVPAAKKVATKTIKAKKEAVSVKNDRMAVIEIGAHQYLVKEGETIKSEKLTVPQGEVFDHAQVLLVAEGDIVKVGTPFVEGATVKLEMVKNFKDEKIRVFHYKSKSRYRKLNGHRQPLTELKVLEINLG